MIIPSHSSPVSSGYVNLINCLKTSHLIVSSHSFHPSPESTWTQSIVWRTLNWSSHPILLTRLPECTWTWWSVWRPLIWSSHPILFTCLQIVRELGQLFEDLSSNHPILSSSPVPRMYVNLVKCLKTSYLIIHPSSFPVSRLYVNWSIVWRPLIWSSHPILFTRLQRVREFGWLFEDLSLIISSHRLHPSSESTWTWLIVWRPLIWSSHPILHPSLVGTWIWSVF